MSEGGGIATRAQWIHSSDELQAPAGNLHEWRSKLMKIWENLRNCIMVNRKLTTQFALLLTAACSQQRGPPESTNKASVNESAEQTSLQPPAPGDPRGLPDDRSPAEGPIDPKSAQGAAQVLQSYFALLEAGKAREAEALWSDQETPAEFAGRVAGYREVHANIGAPGESEGAAGSIYVDVPVQMYGRLRDGKEFSSRGTMTLRRVNDVPGSTAEQRQWHIYKADFPQRTAAAYRFVGQWATNVRNCSSQAWTFTTTSLQTPAGSQCTFRKVTEVPGGYDVAARCTAESPPTNDTLKLRFAESAKALLFHSRTIADAGLVRCS